MAGRWSTSAFGWLGGLGFPCSSSLRSSILRWPPQFMSASWHLTWIPQGVLGGINPHRFLRWRPEVDISTIVDDVVWSVISAFESVALVSMLCFFFLFCGCTI